MYGTQTVLSYTKAIKRFENDVKMYGTQTEKNIGRVRGMFENDVKMYGTQTLFYRISTVPSLRMM